MKQVLSSLPVRTIQRLTQTYVTLSLADIAKAAGLSGAEEAEAVILRWAWLTMCIGNSTNALCVMCVQWYVRCVRRSSAGVG